MQFDAASEAGTIGNIDEDGPAFIVTSKDLPAAVIFARWGEAQQFRAQLLVAGNEDARPEVNIVSDEDFLQWLKTTDASLTFIGDPILGFTSSEGLTPREKSVSRGHTIQRRTQYSTIV
ncbi:hypothetical protein K525DRAFT_275569 [Schizophyllum commune Loenen D]|nr:hypothetical protein K525DRAFT_275569 [Schizophyllum commune Loenen D]